MCRPLCVLSAVRSLQLAGVPPSHLDHNCISRKEARAGRRRRPADHTQTQVCACTHTHTLEGMREKDKQ